MAFGKPQVTFNIREGRVSAGDAAVYVMENSAEKLAEAIVATLDNPELRKRIGEIGFKRISDELSWEQSVKNLAMSYKKLFNSMPS